MFNFISDRFSKKKQMGQFRVGLALGCVINLLKELSHMFALWNWSTLKWNFSLMWLLHISKLPWGELGYIWFHGCVCVCVSLSFSHCPSFSIGNRKLPSFSAGNPRLLILLERKPWKVSDWSQFSPEGAALHPFRGVAQPPHAAGSRTQPHRSSLCSGPNRRMTLFLPLLFNPNP